MHRTVALCLVALELPRRSMAREAERPLGAIIGEIKEGEVNCIVASSMATTEVCVSVLRKRGLSSSNIMALIEIGLCTS